MLVPNPIMSWNHDLSLHCLSTFLAFHQIFKQFLWQHSRSAKCFFGNQIPIFGLGTFREFVARFTGQFPSSCQWFPRMDSPEVEQNVSWTEKKRVTPFRSSWWEKNKPIFVRKWSERALKIGFKNYLKHYTWSVCNYKFPQFGFNKTSSS